MTDETRRWRWRHVAERGIPTYEARPPAGDLRNSGAVVTAHRSATVGRCQVCGRSRPLWRVTLGLPPPLLGVLALGAARCFPPPAPPAPPTRWGQLGGRPPPHAAGPPAPAEA